ncbi:MAG: response regulator [Deltaproteobacteria bacterium]|nr:MAG: response regulator [Deltaproteobacteria bacterium]
MNTEPTANILVVDDDVSTLLAMEALLSGPGRNILTASSGTDALRHLLREDFALILLDVRLPVMDGFETAALIRQRERFRYTPIIFLSAIDTLESDVFRGAASGAVDYLFKPVVPQVLKAKVSVFVDLFRMNEQLKQQAIRQSEERFRLVVDSLQDYAVFMMDPEGRVSSWNRGAERIGGWKQQEVIGELFGRFYIPEDREKGLPALALREAATESRYEEEGWRIRKDGTWFWANLVVTALMDDNGALVGFSAIIRDLTERKRAEEELTRLNAELEERFAEKAAELGQTIGEREKLQAQLLQAQKMEGIGTLAGGIAHDMNNILNVISGYASLILQNPGNTEKVAEGLEVIKETVDRGASLVQQLLASARKSELKFEQIHVNGVLEKLHGLLKETFPKTIDVRLELDPALPSVIADSNLLHQAVLNLCLNARDAMPSGGTLQVITRRVAGAALRRIFQDASAKQYTCITVKDTGVGMNAAIQSRIFEPFFTTKQQGEGTGLGLSVVYGIVTNHKGFIDVESEPDQGTTFRICLPVPKSRETAIEVKEQPPVKDGTRPFGKGETILFAEDEARQLRLMQNFLQDKGYRILPAKDGAEAVEIFQCKKDEIGLVILDLGLPKLNGWEVFRRIKEIDPAVKAIFATGFMTPQIESQLALGEASAVIMKPYQLDEILEKISSVIKTSAGEPAVVAQLDYAEIPFAPPDEDLT